jgi:hypothetical protein
VTVHFLSEPTYRGAGQNTTADSLPGPQLPSSRWGDFATNIRDVVPVEITWSFEEDTGPHPEFSPDEIWTRGSVPEGAKRSVMVNI